MILLDKETELVIPYQFSELEIPDQFEELELANQFKELEVVDVTTYVPE